MDFSIVKSTLPNYSRLFSGRDRNEVEKFLSRPRTISVRIRGLSGDGVDYIAPKLQISILQQLGIDTRANLADVSIISIGHRAAGRGYAEIKLSSDAWRAAFEHLAGQAWAKRKLYRDATKARILTARKRNRDRNRLIVSRRNAHVAAKKKNILNNVLVQIIDRSGNLRAKPAIGSGLNENWNISFPKELRIRGAKYVVEKVSIAKNFYRAAGKITRVV